MATAPVKPVPTKAAKPRRAAPAAAKAKVSAAASMPAASVPVAPVKTVATKSASVKAPKVLANAPAKPASPGSGVAQKLVPKTEPDASVKPMTAKPAKPAKVKKPKIMRDSFTIPKTEHAVLQELKQRAARLMRMVKKSELIRAGIKALAALPDAVFMNALTAVSAITGRPKKTKAKGG